MGYHGLIMVLFETPSGFAIFSFDVLRLLLPDAMKVVCRKEFQFFGDKSTAINLDTGVSGELSDMLKRSCSPGQKLAVAKREYKTITEARLVSDRIIGVACVLYDIDETDRMFSRDVLSKLENDAYKYEGKMYKAICLKIYNELVSRSELRTAKRRQWESFVMEAEKAYEAGQVDDLRCWGLEKPSKSKRLRSQ
ncbi:hypothetical protein BAE44_0018030 [Dichanthelium oligosanthes]|uniref:Uncharacterized protein n=1 Tax=Dichanthelium oligosanthes TaxID=888268 RepID=A0A1E5V7J1_9POAL|nr:hypothetical protein BAE44_0018030 [Dichanthelium oligosanthes]